MGRPKNSKPTKKKPHFGILVAVILLIVADLMYLFSLWDNAFYGASVNLGRAVRDHHSPYNLFKETHLSKLGDRLSAIRNTKDKDKDNTKKPPKMNVNVINNDNNNNKDDQMTKDDGYRKTLTGEQWELIQIAKSRGLKNIDDKGPILEILTQAGLDLNKDGDLDQETLDQLPTWTQVEHLYGRKAVIIGLERCEDFRNSVEPTSRFLGMAGTFNTGTNLIHAVMRHNCEITERMEKYGSLSKGIRWQVPWGKHYMARYRGGEHSTRTDKDVPHDHTMALVSIRDPYFWMQSMCRHGYAAHWPHIKSHCPNLIATTEEIKSLPYLKKMYGGGAGGDEKLIPVDIRYSKNLTHHHLSMAHWYSEWYQDYLSADTPRIMVRFEDLLFRGGEVSRAMCECGGGVPRKDNGRSGKFVHVSESAKTGKTAHGPLKDRTNLVGALIKYGSFAHRADLMTEDDLVAARRHLDPEVMKTFGYSHPPLPANVGGTEDSETANAPLIHVGEMEHSEKANAATESGRYDDDHSLKPEKNKKY
mmetsp:Transcript_19988/g.42252  ORF Transcript_19988/g.42252 Transcript_19988/m.42252 type:complete len:531 (+) Transcript_19988:193-1785(+)